jgi:hypothetical protein
MENKKGFGKFGCWIVDRDEEARGGLLLDNA